MALGGGGGSGVGGGGVGGGGHKEKNVRVKKLLDEKRLCGVCVVPKQRAQLRLV